MSKRKEQSTGSELPALDPNLWVLTHSVDGQEMLTRENGGVGEQEILEVDATPAIDMYNPAVKFTMDLVVKEKLDNDERLRDLLVWMIYKAKNIKDYEQVAKSLILYIINESEKSALANSLNGSGLLVEVIKGLQTISKVGRNYRGDALLDEQLERQVGSEIDKIKRLVLAKI